MAKQRFLQLVREGVADERLWHWTPELAKDPNMREVYVEKGKKPQAVLASEVDEDQTVTLYSARATSFGEYDILKITPAEGEDEDAIEEVVDHITGKEAALARVEELNYPEGRSNIPAPQAPVVKGLSAEERITAIEDAIASLDDADWGKGPFPYPKVPAVSAVAGFQVSFQEIKSIWQNMKNTEGEPEKTEE